MLEARDPLFQFERLGDVLVRRRLMMKVVGADGTPAPASLIVVQHWIEELKRLVPPK